ncbi:MAG: hypothetical protein PHC53_03950 [Patescibacteria group bacterium]|nr:hypothetical protein [Patescibacteria group bacterium]
METKKPTPKPGPSNHSSANTALDEITSYKNGEIIEVDPSDTRIYCVKKGSVQRAVVLPGCNGLGTLLLAKIEPRPDGGYWNPRLAYLHAVRVGINLVLKAVGETTIQKITEESLRSKDPGQLVRIISSLLAGHDREIAETELMIKHQYERAEKEAGSARSANALVESLQQEQEEAPKPAAVTPDQMKRMLEIGQLRQELNSTHDRETKLREELRKLRSQIKSQETRLQLTAIDVRELNDIRKQLIDQARWIEQNCPDLPAVQAIQSLANGPSDDELDAMFEEAFERAAESPQQAAAAVSSASKAATAVVISEVADGDCADVDDDELLPIGEAEEAAELIEIGPADDANDRQTIPFGRKEGDPQPPAVVVPALPAPPIVLAPVVRVAPQVTQTMDMRAIREEAAKRPASTIPPPPIELTPVTEVVQVTRAMDMSEIRRQAAEDQNQTQTWDVVTVPSQAPPHETQGRPWTDSQLDEATLDYVRQPADGKPPMRPKQQTLICEDGVPPPPDELLAILKKGG